MPTVTRLITYTGTQAALDQQLGRSLNDGVKETCDMTIRVLTLPPAFTAVLAEAAVALGHLPDTSLLTRGDGSEKKELG